MTKAKGQGRKVLIFKYFVIKIPYNKFGLISNITESLRYIKYFKNKSIRQFMCPCLCFFGLVIMPKVKVLTQTEYTTLDESSDLYKLVYKYYNHPIMQDIKADNLGYYKNRIVKLDYGDNYQFKFKNKVVHLYM